MLLGTVLLHMAKEVPVYSEHVTLRHHVLSRTIHVMSCPVLPGEGDNRPGRGPGRVQPDGGAGGVPPGGAHHRPG